MKNLKIFLKNVYILVCIIAISFVVFEVLYKLNNDINKNIQYNPVKELIDGNKEIGLNVESVKCTNLISNNKSIFTCAVKTDSQIIFYRCSSSNIEQCILIK